MKLLRFLLFPFAVLYDVITSIRNWCFDVGILKSTSFAIPVIAVGNLSVGGTGKTPQVEYLIRLLKDNYKVAVLSRGYKRKTKGFIKLNPSHSVEDVGDEPLQFFKKFGTEITVAVDANRTNGIQELLKGDNPPDVVLLDDAYQHRKVKASTYILLTKHNDLYADDYVLPVGNLRESRRGAKRASFIIVTKCPSSISSKERERIIKKLKPQGNQKVFFTTIEYDAELKGGEETISIGQLKEKEVVLVTGIENPQPLLTYLTEQKVKYQHLKYPDHHNFSAKELTSIQQVFNGLSTKNKLILTTEKDYVRLVNKVDSLYYIAIKTSFLIDENDFVSDLQNVIKR